MIVLSLDPSVNNVGWAVYDTIQRKWWWGQWKLEANNFQAKCRELALHIELEIGEYDHLVIEWPTFYNSAKGHVAAKMGYTIDLAAIAMYVAGYRKLGPDQLDLVTALEWKGTVTKVVTMKKFMRIFGIKDHQLSDHVIDAIMLLHFWASRSGTKLGFKVGYNLSTKAHVVF